MVVAFSDDLTGAAACAAELARRHGPVSVRAWDAPAGAPPCVIDTASRLLSAAAAAARVESLVRAARRHGGDRALYKRIDSRLRGSVAAELGAVHRASGKPLIVAPAAPALGVTTAGGVQRLKGRPLSSSVLELAPAPAAVVSLEEVRSPGLHVRLAEAAASHASSVCEAETESDLAAIRDAASALDCTLVGSYGLLGAGRPPIRGAAPAVDGHVLVVAGSLAEATRRQLRALEAERRREGGVELLTGPDAAPGDAAERAEIAVELGRRCGELVRARRPAALVLIGGETAGASVRACGAGALDVVAEPWPTVALALIRGGDAAGIPALLKSGAVGGPDWLTRALAYMRADSPKPLPLSTGGAP